MPMATITLKNIPDDLYQRLREVAKAHHRSINSEMINCLELVLKPKQISVEQRVARLRSARARVITDSIGDEEIQRAIDDGRP